MKRLLTMTMILIPVVASAQWGTNWPAWQYPREQNDQIRQCYSATVERCSAVGISAPSAPTWYRANRTTVINIKAKVKALVPLFADINASTNGADLEHYFLTVGTNSSSVIPVCTVTGLLAGLNVPTNYFDYTPWRGISGIGGNVDDESVGHAYGKANSTTASGGTNYPSGRTCWYTTDYGVEGLTGIVSRLMWVGKTVKPCASVYGGERYAHPRWGVCPSFAEIKIDSVSDYAGPCFYPVYAPWHMIGSALQVLTWYDEGYMVSRCGQIMSEVDTWTVTGLSTGFQPIVQFYHWAAVPTGLFFPTNTGAVFNDWGLGLTTNWNFCFEDVAAAASYTNAIGSTNMPASWCADPSGGWSSKADGIDIYFKAQVLVKYDGTNGFKYK